MTLGHLGWRSLAKPFYLMHSLAIRICRLPFLISLQSVARATAFGPIRSAWLVNHDTTPSEAPKRAEIAHGMESKGVSDAGYMATETLITHAGVSK